MSKATNAIAMFGIGTIVLVFSIFLPYIGFDWFNFSGIGITGYRALMTGLFIVAAALMLKPLEYIVRGISE